MYICNKDIIKRIKELSVIIEQDYKNLNNITVVGVMDGCLMFLSELFKNINLPLQLNTIKSKSYLGTKKQEDSKLDFAELKHIYNNHILLIDDICDTGETLYAIKSKIMELKPLSIATVVLVHKHIPGHKTEVDYRCFDVGNDFVVGFGMDYNGLFRNYPHITDIKNIPNIEKVGN